MNIYEKLQKCRVELQGMNLKKSGHNKFANFHYFELADFLPSVNALFEKYKICSNTKFEEDVAMLIVINSEKPEEILTFTTPTAKLELKGANLLQNLGGQITYLRRYLYVNALEITENDFFDSVLGKEDKKTKKATKKENNIEDLYILADSKGIDRKALNFISKRDYKKDIVDLTFEEFSEFCDKLESFERA